ncbi:MAG: hypothetical protein ACO38P_02775 [Phycisphaerales bacterium]
MTLAAKVYATVSASSSSTKGLTQTRSEHPIEFSISVGDCTSVWSDRRIFDATGYDDVDLLNASGLSVVKLVCLKNLSGTSSIALGAGWSGSDFRNFSRDVNAWNFSPMINLGSLTLRGYPIRPNGSFLLACPNSDGFSTTGGGSILRVGGVAGQAYEIYVMGT